MVNAIGTGSQRTITGLPATVGSLDGNGSCIISTAATNFVTIVPQAGNGGTAITMYGLAAAGASFAQMDVIGSGTTIQLSVTYRV